MKTFRLALIDFKLGVFLKKRYLVLVLLCGFYCSIFQVFSYNLDSAFGIREFNLGDLIAFVHCGTIPGIRLIPQNEFRISYMWLALLMLQLLLPLDYPVSSMENWGYPYVMKVSRREWWLAKCIYTIMVNLIGFLLEIGTFAVYSQIKLQDMGIQCHKEVAQIIFGSADGGVTGLLSTNQSILLLMILPFLGIAAMSQVLLLMSVSFNRTTAYIAGTAWIIASVFLAHPLLPGNCTMAIRSSIIDSRGMLPATQTFSCIGIFVSAIAAGTWIIQHKDFFIMIHDE